MTKRILIISESIDVNDSSGSKVNVALIKNLHKIGYELLVFHYTRRVIELEGIKCIAIPEIKFSIFYVLSRLQRYFTKFTQVHLHRSLESVFGFSFTFFNDAMSISKFLKSDITRNFNPDLVITLSKGASFRPHYAMRNLGYLQKKWMAYIHDPYPFQYYPRPYNWVEQGYRRKELFFQDIENKASYFAFPSKLLMEWMGSYFPQMEAKGIIIPHQSSSPIITNEFPRFFQNEQFTLLHAGALMKQRNPKWLINAYLNFLVNNPEAEKDTSLILIGNHEYHEKLLATYKNHRNLFVDGHIEYQITQNLQNAASVNIILESKAEISPFLPGKFPNCVQANKPILLLSPYYSESRRLLGENYEFWSEVDDELKIQSHIQILYDKWKRNINDLKLDRSDLIEYCNIQYLESLMNSIS